MIIFTVLTAGGSNDTEMATPTKEASFPANRDIATAQPDGKATRVPTQAILGKPLSFIITVGHCWSAQWSVKLSAIRPKK